MNYDRQHEDERIGRAARGTYNVPPATPREEMWSVIEARLETGERNDVIPLERAGRGRTIGGVPWWMAVAAALLIGLALGRLSLGTGEPGVATDPEAPETTLVEAPEAGAPGDPEPAAAERSPSAGEPSGADGSTGARGAAPPDVRDRSTLRRAPYLAATREHLNRSESFLSGVRVDLASGESGGDDEGFEPWARSLLSRTRLLLASPAGRDPETRRLLEDLELMLAQVVATAATSDPAEVRLLGEGLEGNLLRRLRAAAGPETGITRTSSL